MASMSNFSWPYIHEFIFDLSILFHYSLSVFMPEPYCFDYYSFAINFEVRNCDATSFVLPSENYFGYLWSLRFHMNFRIISSISVKKCHQNFDKECTESLDVLVSKAMLIILIFAFASTECVSIYLFSSVFSSVL